MDLTELKGQWLKVENTAQAEQAKTEMSAEDKAKLEQAFKDMVAKATVSKARKEKIEVVIESPSIYTSPQLTAEKRTPMPTLLRIGAQMIAEGRRDEWKILLNQKMGRRRAFRRQQLAEKHPKAVFYTLSGDRFSSSDFVFSDKPKVSFASTAIH